MRVLVMNWKDTVHPLAGGAEVYTQRVGQRLVDLGHEVTFFVAAVEGQPQRETVAGVTIVRSGTRFGVYAAARRFWKEEGEGEFDVVVDECNTRPFLTPRYVRRVPVVGLVHQVAREVWRYEMPLPVAIAGRYVLEPWWLRSYRDVPVMTISPSSAASLARYGVRNTIVLPIGADDVERPAVGKASRPTVVFLGRISPNKRPDHAVEAVQVLRQRVPDAQLWMMGDGPMRTRIARHAADGIEILGHVPWDERQKRLAQAHVLVTTSVREGWGLNVSEAAAVGTPTVGYAVDGLRDSIPRSGGHLVEPHPRALADALTEFFAGHLALVPTVSTVPWAAVGDAVDAVLHDVVSRSRPAP